MTLSVTMREWHTRGPSEAADSPLRGVRLSESARQQCATINRSQALCVRELADGLEVESRSHVGRLQLGEVTITIQPKLPGPHLLSLLRYAYGLRDLRLLTQADYADTGTLLQDLVAAQLLAEVSEIFRRGLRREYTPVDDWLSSPRGRLDVLQLAQAGALIDGSLPCRHFPRTEDSIHNRVLLGGLRLAAGVASDRILAGKLRRTAAILETMVQEEPLSWAMLAQAERRLNRLVAAYESALHLTRLLYSGRSISFEEEQGEVRLAGFLFDMNRFFQALLLRFLRENLESGYQLKHEVGVSGMFSYDPAANPRNRRSPTPRPDYALMRDGRALTFLDAKYRDLWETRLPREMLYQLSLYALSGKAGHDAVILYPVATADAVDQRIEIADPLTGAGRGSVVLRPVHLGRLDEVVHSDTPGERRSVARRLVGLSPSPEHWRGDARSWRSPGPIRRAADLNDNSRRHREEWQ